MTEAFKEALKLNRLSEKKKELNFSLQTTPKINLVLGTKKGYVAAL